MGRPDLRDTIARLQAFQKAGADVLYAPGLKTREEIVAVVRSWEKSEDLLAQVVARFERWNTIDEIIASPVVRANMIGSSPAWLRALRQVIEIAHFTSASVLISGESGTGKEFRNRLDAVPR